MSIYIHVVTSLWVITALPLLGCGGGPQNDPGPVECTPEVEITSVQSYIVTWIDWAGENIGFDLDGEWTSCDSGCINDGDQGADNRMSVLIDGMRDSLGDEGVIGNLGTPAGAARDGDLLLLLTVLEGVDGDGRECRSVLYHGGVDTDDDPTDNASGEEEFLITRDSVAPGAGDPIVNGAWGLRLSSDVRCSGCVDGLLAGPAPEAVIHRRLPGSEVVEIRVRRLHVNMIETMDGIEGMLGGFLDVADQGHMVYAFDPEHWLSVDIDETTILNWMKNQSEGDLLPGGALDEDCDVLDDCEPWRPCIDGSCHEPPGVMDSISFAWVFRAVPCSIEGVAGG
jgi:hypothetical protein